MKRTTLFLFITLIGFISCSKKKEPLVIAVSSNTYFVSATLIDAFEKKKAISCDIISSSSGKLCNQIKERAPFNIFLSADISYPQQLFEGGYTIEKPKIYAYGKLALWLNKDIDSLSDLKINHIAIANPEVAPYGKVSLSYLKNLPDYPETKSKLIYGESIAQVNQFIATQTVDAALTSFSTSFIPNLKGSFQEIPTALYSPIEQGAVIIKQDSDKNKQAKLFYDFLFSEEAQTILKECGYLVPEK